MKPSAVLVAVAAIIPTTVAAPGASLPAVEHQVESPSLEKRHHSAITGYINNANCASGSKFKWTNVGSNCFSYYEGSTPRNLVSAKVDNGPCWITPYYDRTCSGPPIVSGVLISGGGCFGLLGGQMGSIYVQCE